MSTHYSLTGKPHRSEALWKTLKAQTTKSYRDVGTPKVTLDQYGEFRLLNEVLFPIIHSRTPSSPVGDDCVFTTIPDGAKSLVITSDVAPRPLVWSLGYECYRTGGWYAVACNASDLASAGADMHAFTSSVEAPDSMPIEDFRQFFIGLVEACKAFGLIVAGGNIRTAPHFACHGTAIGVVPHGSFLKRDTAKPGDLLVVVGNCGRFVCEFLKARANGISSLNHKELAPLLRPWSQHEAMRQLRLGGVVRAASDNSDGLLGAIWNICERSECAAEINMDASLLPNWLFAAAQQEKVNPWRLMFFWGDWNVVVTVGRDSVSKFRRIVSKHRIRHLVLGELKEGPPALYGKEGHKWKRLALIRNENFIRCGYNRGQLAHVDFMLHSKLFEA